jgi:hypothetical protein
MNSKSKVQLITSYKEFVREIHKSSKSGRKQPTSLRRGLNMAKLKTDSRCYYKILQDLGNNSTYLGLVAPTQFPTSLSSIKKGLPGLVTGSTGEELIWNAAVLSIFKDKLAPFLDQKGAYDKALFAGDYGLAERTLEQIQKDFGFSIWLIKNKIYLKQAMYGLKEQKDYVEEVINSPSISLQAALLSYHASIRAEENVTFHDLDREVSEIQNNVVEYFIYHIMPSKLEKIVNPENILFYEQTQPLIDRLLAYVSVCQLAFIQGNVPKEQILEALKLSAWIPDKDIQRLLVLTGISALVIDEDLLNSYRNYSLGNYEQISVEALDAIELKAHAYVYVSDITNSEAVVTPSSMQDEIISQMASIITCSGDQVKARVRLEKLSLLAPTPSVWYGISAFLDRTNEVVSPDDATDKEKLAAISNNLCNPKSWAILKSISKDYITFNPAINPEISSLEPVRLFEFLDAPFDEGVKGIDTLKLPEYRALIYKGHLALKNSRLDCAEKYYRQTLAMGDKRHSDRVTAYLFQSIFAKGDIEGSVNIVVDHCLENPNAVIFYPLKDLSIAALEIKKLKSSVATAILLHLTSRHVHPKWERKLSNIHENIIAKLKLDRPSGLKISTIEDQKQRLVYFLRYVCISRILDDSSAYGSVEEIEEERIAICQLLATIDPKNKSVYSTEIKDITRNEKLATIWHHFQSGKIYIDEDGLRNHLEPTFKETFNRYVVLRDSPSLNVQAEKLAKALERIINDKSLDFKNIKLPASETESLFNTMVQNFIQAFAAHPAYGLDTHISTAIRHGVFEGHIRTALRHLMCSKSKEEYKLPYVILQKIQSVAEDVGKVEKVLVRFTKRIETLINSYLTDYLRIYSVDAHPSGLFMFILTEEIRSKSMDKLMNISDYDAFMNELLSLAWTLTDNSIEHVKQHIRQILEAQIQQAFHTILEGLRSDVSPQTYSTIEHEVIDARLKVQQTVEDICGWFNRPQLSSQDDIELELVLAVALKQIENCYISNRVFPSISSMPVQKIQGRLLTSIVETLFILLQNIIIHSGIENDIRGISISFDVSGDDLVISVRNPIAENVDLILLDESIRLAGERYNSGAGLTRAGTEGGSGLSKIWRMMEYEVKKHHVLELILEGRSFSATLTISNLEMV